MQFANLVTPDRCLVRNLNQLVGVFTYHHFGMKPSTVEMVQINCHSLEQLLASSTVEAGY